MATPTIYPSKEVIYLAKKITTLIVLLASLAIGMTFSSVASANAMNTPIPGTMTATSSAFATGLAVKNITVKTWVGVQEHIRIQRVPQSQCQWFSRFKNSDYLLGQTNYVPGMYWDYNGYLCRDRFSPTGWVKRGGGHTGANCGNIAAPPFVPTPRFRIIPPPSVELKHNTTLFVWVYVTVHAEAHVKLWCGWATGNGSASDKVKVNYLSLIRSSGAAKVSLFVKVAVKAADQAKGAAQVSCTYTPPPTSPPPNQPPPPPPPPPFTCPPGQVQTSPGVCHTPPLAVSATRIQEIFTNAQGVVLCMQFTGDDINRVTMNATYGTFLDGGNAYFDSSKNAWCDNTYQAPSEPPPLVTPVPLPNDAPYPNNNAADTYDVVTGNATTSEGLTASGKNYVLVIQQPAPPQ